MRSFSEYLWVAVLLGVAWPLLRRTLGAALRGNFATDAVASLAIITSIVLFQPIPGFIIVLMQMGGEALERMARGKASRALSVLEQQAPRIAHVRTAGDYREVAVDSVEPGDELLIRPGEIVPVDCEIVEGQSNVDTAQITGEPLPVRMSAGSALLSGYWNLNSPLVARASRKATESQYARIVELVRKAQSEKAPIQRVADRYAVWFTPFTVVVAVSAWLLSGDVTRLLAVLVVATPCPLLLATPVAMLGGINSSARRNVIVRSGAGLERLAGIRAVAFDKTGTLTEGHPAAHRITIQPGWNEDHVLRLAAALELASSHALARAVVAEARRRSLAFDIARDAEQSAGRGIRGTVEGHHVAIGSRGYITEAIGIMNTAASANGASVDSYIAVDGKLAGAIRFQDEIRSDAVELVQSLRDAGIQHVAMLSGDDAATVRDVAALVGIQDTHGNLTPDQKLKLLALLMKTHGATLMVGDGTNDAPALAAATVGLAVAPRGGGIATETADIILISDNLLRIREVHAIARRTMKIAKQSIIVGLGLSACGMVAAAFGLLAPVAGAIFQEAVDVGVILNALRATQSGIGISPTKLQPATDNAVAAADAL